MFSYTPRVQREERPSLYGALLNRFNLNPGSLSLLNTLQERSVTPAGASPLSRAVAPPLNQPPVNPLNSLSSLSNNPISQISEIVGAFSPSAGTGLNYGYMGAELLHRLWGQNLGGGDQGARLGTSTGLGAALGGPIGAVGGLAGGMVSNIINPGESISQQQEQISMRTQGEVWQDIFSSLSAEEQKSLTSIPTVADYDGDIDGLFNALENRVQTVGAYRNEVENGAMAILEGTEQQSVPTYSDSEESISSVIGELNRIEENAQEVSIGSVDTYIDMRLRNVGIYDFMTVIPPMKLESGWIYANPEKLRTMPLSDQKIWREYTYEDYLNAILEPQAQALKRGVGDVTYQDVMNLGMR